VFAFNQLEGRRAPLGKLRRAAIAYSAFKQEAITFRFNSKPTSIACFVGLNAGKRIRRIGLGGQEPASREINVETALNLASQQGLSPEERATQVQEFEYQLDLAFRRSLEARVKNVPRDGLLAGIKPLEEFEFSLDEEEEEQREELTTSTLTRTGAPAGCENLRHPHGR